MGFKEWQAERDNAREAYDDWFARSVGLTEDEAYDSPEWLAAKERYDQAYDAVPWWRRIGICS